MADTVTSQTLTDTSGVKTVIKFTNSSDGTGESLVNKFDASALTHLSEDGTKVISKINWSINTADSKSGVEVIWDGATNATACLLSGQGYWDLNTDGNGITNNATTPTGDILFSTKNFANGDNYTIILEVR